MASSGKNVQPLGAWFQLTPEERLILGGILLIALIGLIARYVHLKHQSTERSEPETIGLQNSGAAEQ